MTEKNSIRESRNFDLRTETPRDASDASKDRSTSSLFFCNTPRQREPRHRRRRPPPLRDLTSHLPPRGRAVCST